jgi:hypothetical protein
MIGIQLVRLLDVLPTSSFSNAPGVVPRSLIVRGRDFRNVESVLINGFTSPEFVAYSETALIAQVPEGIEDAIITGVTVLSTSLTFTERSLVELTLGTRPKKVTGTLRLIQVFLRQLLRTQGTNIFHPRSGGGMIKRVGGITSQQAAADVAIAVAAARQYVINAQTQDRNIPPSERLLSADIQALTADPRSTSIYVTILLTSHSGQTGAATLTL